MNNDPQGLSDGQLRWGILGTGFVAGLQTQDLVNNGFTVQAVGSRSLATGIDFSKKFGIPTVHGSYEALIADPDVDVIYIATPHTFHHAHTLLALHAGKHALVEKPFAMNAEEVREILDLAQTKGLVALEAMWTRFLPHMIRIRELVSSGKLGDIKKVVASHNQNLPKDPAHRLNNPALGGGALLDLGIYPVSFAIDILGVPATITASASMTPTGVDGQTVAIFGYDNGEQAVIDCQLNATAANTAAIIGTDGWIDIEPVWYTPSAFTAYAADGTVLERFDKPVKDRGMQFQAAELERLVHSRATSGDVLPASESLAVMKTMDAIRAQIGLRYNADTRTGADTAGDRRAHLRGQEEELVFDQFSHADAWSLGSAMVNQAYTDEHNIAIDISSHHMTLFTTVLPGATADQAAWVRRKSATTLRFEHSTALLKEEFDDRGVDPTQRGWLAADEYTLAAGSFPVRVKGVGVVAAVTVSGLASNEDHEFVVSQLRKHLNQTARAAARA